MVNVTLSLRVIPHHVAKSYVRREGTAQHILNSIFACFN